MPCPRELGKGSGDQGRCGCCCISKALPLVLFLPSLLVPSRPSIPSSWGKWGQPNSHIRVGMERGWWEWAGQRSVFCPSSSGLDAHPQGWGVGASLEECELAWGHSPGPDKLLVPPAV